MRKEAQGLWHLGDQAAVIPSFTGDGMSLALHTARLAADMYMAGSEPREFQRSIAAQIRLQVRLATLVSKTLVNFPRMSLLTARLWPGAVQALAGHTRIAQKNLLARPEGTDSNSEVLH